MCRSRREFDYGHCHHFIKSFGNVVSIKDGKIETIWNFDADNDMYQPVIDVLDTFIKSKPITDVYFAPMHRIGMECSHEYTGNEVLTWNHFYVDVTDKFVKSRGMSINTIKARYRYTKNVFYRSLESITEDALNTVLELIAANTLYRGKNGRAF